MANVRFLQSVLAGLIAATLLAGGVTGTLLVQAFASDDAQFASHQPQSPELEAVK